MEKQIYKFPEIEQIIDEQKYKYCSLENYSGETLIPWNSIKAPLKKRIEEIRTRIKRLPAGIYAVNCKTVYGTHAKGDRYYFTIGKVRAEDLQESKSPIVTERVIEKSSDKLSVEKALENFETIAELKSENARLRAKVEQLEREIEELETELEDPENLQDSEPNGLEKMFKELIPVIDPIATKYFELEEKKLNFNQAKFLSENGYEIPGMKKRNGSPRQSPQVNKTREIPQPGAEGWNEYIDYLLELDEQTFITHLEQVREADPALCEAIENEVYQEDENPGEEEGE